MPRTTLETRMAALEQQMAELIQSNSATNVSKSWRSTLGAFTGDDCMKEILALGREIREKERHLTKPGEKKSRKRNVRQPLP